jgi:hypothetical protein
MEGYDRAVQLCTALDSQPQDTLRLVFPRFADVPGNATSLQIPGELGIAR